MTIPPQNSPLNIALTPKRMGFRKRTTLALFALLLTLTATIIGTMSYWQIQQIRKNANSEAQSVTNSLSQDFVRILLLDSGDAAADVASKLETFSQIRYLAINDRAGKLHFAYLHPDESALKTEPLAQVAIKHPRRLFYEIPLTYKKMPYGTIQLVYSDSEIEAKVTAFFRNILFLIPALLLMSYGISAVMQRWLLYPLKQLAVTVDDINRSNDYNKRMPTDETDEFGTLINGFNRMLDTINVSQADLQSEKERLQVTLRSIADGVITTDIKGNINYLNPVAEFLLHTPYENAIGIPLEQVFRLHREDTDQALVGQLDSCLTQGEIRFNFENTYLLTDNKRIAVETSFAPIRGTEQNIEGSVVIFRNVSEARELARRLEYQASHDNLTELLNRNEFESRIKIAIRDLNPGKQHALLYLDLDQFKVVNDTGTHIAGDHLLQQMATIIRGQVREADVVARLGGDEFGILLPFCTTDQAKGIGEKLRQAINEFSFGWNNRLYRVGVSIGVVMIDSATIPYVELLRNADIACYAAKNLGRNRLHVYEPSDKELIRMHGEMQWLNVLEQALDKDLLKLFIQQIVPVDPQDSLFRFEVLVRLIESDGCIYFPGSFLPAAERYGLMQRVDYTLIRKSLDNPIFKKLFAEGLKVELNINISWVTLGDPDSLEIIREMVVNGNVPPTAICFEITESSVTANVAASLKFMRNLKLLGCKFALDDFGSGLSSFGYLKILPVDYIKIDGSLVKDIETDKTDLAMIESIARIGSVMNLKTVAEFVHNEATYNLAKQVNIDYLQGYYIHRPAPLEEIFAIIAETANKSACR